MSFSSQLSGSSGNSSLAWSMGNGGKGFVIIKFPLALDNGWYSEQPCTKFRTFQHRKERKGLKHEFVVLKLLDGSVCRVERMGDPDARFNALSPQGSTAQDLAQCFGLEELEAARLGYSDLITEVELPHEFDLMDVLKICRAIQEGEKTRNYTLQVYNCYFFALAIQVCLTRFIAYWEDHGQFTVWLSTVGNAVNALADPIQIIPPKFPTYYPTVFKLYSTLSSLGGQATFMLMKETKSKLQDQIEAQPDMSYRINNLLWHSAIDSSLNEFIEEMVKQGLIAIFRERIAGRTTDTEPFKDRTPDDLFRNVRDLTSTTKIIGTKPFAYGGYSDIWRGVEWGTGGARDVSVE
ncbi:unnamed protein product [Rhizoctonia solani]|uniref:Uncharacterized protein n=1 Tax=Rhizoctonia solani TaxID=456999 RepID=A0A8H3CUI4_9AGAM|nr:unnamed protein product [Rhizoctonia solani]